MAVRPQTTAERDLLCEQETLLHRIHSGVQRTRYDGRGEVQYTSVADQIKVMRMLDSELGALAGRTRRRRRLVLIADRGIGGGR